MISILAVIKNTMDIFFPNFFWYPSGSTAYPVFSGLFRVSTSLAVRNTAAPMDATSAPAGGIRTKAAASEEKMKPFALREMDG